MKTPRYVIEEMVSARVVAMAKAGFYTRAIAAKCGLSQGQVHYRIHQGNAVGARNAYRAGTSVEATMVVESLVNTWVNSEHERLMRQLKARLKAVDHKHQQLKKAA